MVQLELLANEGNFKHNVEVFRKGTGSIVVARRTAAYSHENHPRNFLPCEHCRKFVLRRNLWSHSKFCNARPSRKGSAPDDDDDDDDGDDGDRGENDTPYSSNAVRRGQHLLHSALLDETEELAGEMFTRMKNDDIRDIIFHDELIKRYAALRVEALGEKSVQKINDIHRVSQGARSLGRLIKEARAKKPLVSMDTLMKPENFDLVVATTKAMSVEKEKPVLTLPRYIGNLLGHIIQIKIGHALRSNDEIKCDEATKFQRLMSAEWNFRVNSAAVKKLNVTKRNQVQAVPLTDDLVRLREYILTEMEEEMTQL